MAESISSTASTASLNKEEQQHKIYSLFDSSPLRHSCCSVKIKHMHDLYHPRIFRDFPAGYMRLINEEDGQNALYYVDKKNHILKNLGLNEDELIAYDAAVASSEKPAALSASALKAIAEITHFIPKKSVLLQEHIQSLGLIAAPPAFVFTHDINYLLRTNPAIFKYLTPVERKALEINLRQAYYQLGAQRQATCITGEGQFPRINMENLEHCAFLLRNLELVDKEEELEAHKKQAQNSGGELNQWEKKLNQWRQEKINFWIDFSAGKTVYFTRWMNELNVWNSYWGWAGQTLRTAAHMLPQNFHHIQQTIEASTSLAEPLRILSSILHYISVSINFALILRHSLKGPWMSEEEKELIEQKGGTWNQFTERLAAQKLALINNLIFVTNTLVRLLWLAKHGLGPFGDLLTIVLLTGDVYLSYLATTDAQKKRQQEIQFYDDEIAILKKKIQGDNSADTRARIAIIDDEQFQIARAQLARLEQARDRCEDHWSRQLKERTINVYYAAGVAIGFILMVFPWVEIGVKASAEALVMGATAYCFVLALLYAGYKAYMEVTKAQDSRMSALEECHALLSVDGPLSEADYIRYKDMFAQAKYQEEMEKHQYYVLIRSVIIQSIIPIAIFAGFTFATFGIGLVVFAIVAAVAILTHYALEYFKPEEAALAEFEEEHYHAFSKEDEKKSVAADIKMMKSKGVAGLFSSKKENENDLKPDIAADPSLAG